MRSTVLLCLALSTASLAAACVVEDPLDDPGSTIDPNTSRDGSADATSSEEEEEEPGTDAGQGSGRGDAGQGDAGRGDAGRGDASAPADAAADARVPVEAGPAALTKAQIQTLFAAKCNGCHAAGGGAGGLSLEPDFLAPMLGVASGQAAALQMVKRGDSANSYLMHKLKGTQASVGGFGQRMPRGGAPLTDLEIAGIGAFIDALP